MGEKGLTNVSRDIFFASKICWNYKIPSYRISKNITSFAQISSKQALKYTIFSTFKNGQMGQTVSKRLNGNHDIYRKYSRISRLPTIN